MVSEDNKEKREEIISINDVIMITITIMTITIIVTKPIMNVQTIIMN